MWKLTCSRSLTDNRFDNHRIYSWVTRRVRSDISHFGPKRSCRSEAEEEIRSPVQLRLRLLLLPRLTIRQLREPGRAERLHRQLAVSVSTRIGTGGRKRAKEGGWPVLDSTTVSAESSAQADTEKGLGPALDSPLL